VALLLCVPASPYLWWKGLGAGWKQRLGRIPDTLQSLPQRPLWLHAASVGETLAAVPLVTELRRHLPQLPLVASTTTLTGQAVALRELRPDAATLLPVDVLRIVDRALRRVRPRCLLLVETEIWPGLLRAADEIDCPVVMVSGRVSPRSVRRYRWMRPVIAAALRRVSRFGMQTSADAERIIGLGAPPERVCVTGNLKGGRKPAINTGPAPIAGLNRPLLVAASTQPGEEEFVLAACRDLFAAHESLLLLIAPRRPERFRSVAELVEETGLRYERRSAMKESIATPTRVLLLDTVGELAHFLPSALAVFVGGSIAPLGGHNVLEPAAFGKPVAFGPHTDTVADAAEELCKAGGGVTVGEPAELAALWRRVLDEPGLAAEMGARARAVAEERSQAVERTWAIVAPYLDAVDAPLDVGRGK